MVAWNLPDPIPVHREPIYTPPRPDLVADYPTLPDARQFRIPNIGFSVQKAAVDRGISKQFPLILSSGRLVEYEGGGEETRSNKWLAELKQHMYVEINRRDERCEARHQGRRMGLGKPAAEKSGSRARMKALVTERVGKGVAWMPYHFAGWYEGATCAPNIRKVPIRSCSARASTRSRPMATIPRPACRSPRPTLCQIKAA